MSLNSFLTNKFTKNIPYGTMVQALIVRYQTLFIIYINLAFLLIMVIWTLSDQFLFSLPGKSLIMPILPLILASLASLKSGKVDMAAGLLLLYLHTANFICSHVGDLVLGSSQLLLLLPGIGYFISSSRTVHILNVLFCVLQNTGHIITISSVFQVTFTEEQSFQIFIFKAISFPMLLQSSLLFFAQKSIESKLWQMVQSNCERAEEITKELVEALEAKDVFVSSLSHEIRNPLNSLTGSIDYLLKVIKDNAHLQVLENAKLSGEVLLNLVSNLLDAAKLKSEKMELSYMETNPVDIIKKVLTINSSAFSHKRIFAQAFIEKNVPKKLTLDSSRILQILMNLVSNAIKFTFEGGRIQIQMTWCSLDKAHEELLQAMDTKCLADSVNCEDELFMTPKHSMMVDRRDSITKGMSTVAPVTKDTVDSLCSSPNNEPACCDEFSTVESQSHICNLRHLKDNKKVKGLGQVYSFHSLLSENYDVLTASNMGPKSLYSLDDLICGTSEEKAAETKGYLKMQVTDTGCGIAEENIPKLFSMFSQADANVSRQYGGTGLGLWISKQLCQKMGGDIAVYSKLDHGTTFTFYIEVNNNMSMTDSTSKTLTKRHRGKVRALVVDDYAYNRDLHKLILEREGVEVHLACDGNEAVAKYKANEDDYFDFIMMDIQMPGLDGLSAAQQIRAFETEKNYKIVDIYFVSGNYYANEAGILVENIPRTQFLRKPVNLDIIKKIVGTYGTLLRDINNSGNKRKNSFSKGRSHARKLSPNVVNCANQLMAAASTVSSGEADRKKGVLEANRIRNNVSDGTIMAQKKAVLIVDDDNFNIFTIQLQLENQNLDILVAHNGQEALEIVARKHDEIDVVLMDCEMPIMSGYESTAKIRELEKNEKNLRPLRIYGLSGHTDNAHRVKCINSGMNNVLTKPLDFQKVVDLIYDIST